MDLKIDVTTGEDYTWVALAGDLTSEFAPRLRQVVMDLADRDAAE